MTKSALQMDAAAARFELEIPIDAPRERVWQLVCERPNDWWIADLRCIGADSAIHFEPRAGGTLIEQSQSGSSLLWFTVIAIEPPRSVNLAGTIAPPFGGPCQTYLLIELDEDDDRTIVRVTNSLHGHYTDGMLQEMRSGWQALFHNGLKALAEQPGG